MSERPLDARQVRTLRALRDAILELAADKPVQSVTMAELARRAGVHRSTVYQHVASPSALLTDLLGAELDEVREAHLSPAHRPTLGQATHQAVLGVLAHLERHDALYERELIQPGSPLRYMLRQHFAASVAGLIEEHGLGPDEVPIELFRTAAPRWIADATVGAMTEWLLLPPPRDAQDYVRLHRALLPPWWPHEVSTSPIDPHRSG